MCKIIAFAGLDGCGKTTQSQNLKENLERQHYKVEIFNPMHANRLLNKLKRAGRGLRQDYEAILGSEIVGVVHLLDVWNYFNRKIRTLYDKCDFIILERYTVDFYVYSTILKSNLEFQENVLDNMDKPVLYVYLDTDPKLANERVSKRREVECKRKHYQTLPRTRKLFLEHITKFNNIVIKTESYSPQQISNIIINKLKEDNVL